MDSLQEQRVIVLLVYPDSAVQNWQKSFLYIHFYKSNESFYNFIDFNNE